MPRAQPELMENKDGLALVPSIWEAVGPCGARTRANRVDSVKCNEESDL